MTSRRALIFGLLLCAVACQAPGRVADLPTLGVMLPLTGPLASYGQSGREGAELAVSESRDNSGPVARVVFEDDRGDVRTGLTVFTKLVELDSAEIVVGAMASGVTLAIAPAANRARVVLISPTSTASEVSKAGDYIFRVCASDSFEGPEMARFIAKTFPRARIGVVSINNEYGVGLKADFTREARSLGLNIVLDESYAPSATDFRPIVQKARQAEVAVLYLVAQKEQLLMIGAMRQLGFRPQLTASTMLEDGELLKAYGPFLEGSIYTYRAYDPTDGSQELTTSFVRAYKARFGRIPDFYAASVYDATRVALHALANAGRLGQTLQRYLYDLRSFPGVTGSISFDRNGDVTQGFRIKMIKNGQFQSYEPSTGVSR